MIENMFMAHNPPVLNKRNFECMDKHLYLGSFVNTDCFYMKLRVINILCMPHGASGALMVTFVRQSIHMSVHPDYFLALFPLIIDLWP